ncbi:MAG: hypothetical protein ACYC96_16860 [Fimbriimonadaceae bacterium]
MGITPLATRPYVYGLVVTALTPPTLTADTLLGELQRRGVRVSALLLNPCTWPQIVTDVAFARGPQLLRRLASSLETATPSLPAPTVPRPTHRAMTETLRAFAESEERDADGE